MSVQSLELDTKYGKMDVHITDGKHLCVRSKPDGYNFVIRGVGHNVTAHCYRWSDGEFHVGEEKHKDNPGNIRYHSIYMSPNWNEKRTFDPTPAAKRAAHEAIEAAIFQFARSVPLIWFNTAEEEHLSDQIASKRKDIEQHEAAIRGLKSEILKLEEQINDIYITSHPQTKAAQTPRRRVAEKRFHRV
jgi:hypothetical protein